MSKWGFSLSRRFVGSLMFLPYLSGFFRTNYSLYTGGRIIKYEEMG